MADGMQIHIDGSAVMKAAAILGAEATKEVAKEFYAASVESMSYAQEFMANYPPPPQGYHMTFVSDKQRRWFFAALRAGEIEVPYRRTGTLGRTWRFTVDQVRSDANQVASQLNNVTPYAHWVQDRESQAGIHRGRWQTLQQLYTPNKVKTMAEFFNKAVMRAHNTLVAAIRSQVGG